MAKTILRYAKFPNERKKRIRTFIDDSIPGQKTLERMYKDVQVTRSKSISHDDHAGERRVSPHNSSWCFGPIVCALCFRPIERVLPNKQIHTQAADSKRKVGKQELKTPTVCTSQALSPLPLPPSHTHFSSRKKKFNRISYGVRKIRESNQLGQRSLHETHAFPSTQ